MTPEEMARIAARIAARKSAGMSAEEYNAHERRVAIEAAVARRNAIEQQICDFVNDGFMRSGSKTRARMVRGKATIPFVG